MSHIIIQNKNFPSSKSSENILPTTTNSPRLHVTQDTLGQQQYLFSKSNFQRYLRYVNYLDSQKKLQKTTLKSYLNSFDKPKIKPIKLGSRKQTENSKESIVPQKQSMINETPLAKRSIQLTENHYRFSVDQGKKLSEISKDSLSKSPSKQLIFNEESPLVRGSVQLIELIDKGQKKKRERRFAICSTEQNEMSINNGGRFFKLEKSVTLNNRMIKQLLLQKKWEEEQSEDLYLTRFYIKKVINNMTEIKNYLNNKRQSFLQIKKLIGPKKTLQKILLKGREEGILEMINEKQLESQLKFKEVVYDQGDNLILDKIDFEINKEFQYFCDKSDEFLMNIKMRELQRREQKIINEHEGIVKIQSKRGQSRREITRQDLTYQCELMKHFAVHKSLENFEDRFGECLLINRQTRITSQELTKIIKKINYCNQQKI